MVIVPPIRLKIVFLKESTAANGGNTAASKEQFRAAVVRPIPKLL